MYNVARVQRVTYFYRVVDFGNTKKINIIFILFWACINLLTVLIDISKKPELRPPIGYCLKAHLLLLRIASNVGTLICSQTIYPRPWLALCKQDEMQMPSQSTRLGFPLMTWRWMCIRKCKCCGLTLLRGEDAITLNSWALTLKFQLK